MKLPNLPGSPHEKFTSQQKTEALIYYSTKIGTAESQLRPLAGPRRVSLCVGLVAWGTVAVTRGSRIFWEGEVGATESLLTDEGCLEGVGAGRALSQRSWDKGVWVGCMDGYLRVGSLIRIWFST
eukprot:763616-Hanusia_phi.AAC.3